MAGYGGTQIASLRQQLHDKIVENYAVKKGQIVAGLEVRRRRIHTIGSACAAYNLQRHSLRHALETIGHAAGRTKAAQVLINDDTVRDHLIEYSAALNIKDVTKKYGLTKKQFLSIRQAGIVKELYPEAPGTSLYRPSDLEEFLGELVCNSMPTADKKPLLSAIPKAAIYANCDFTEMIRLIIDREIHVYCSARSPKFSELRVNYRDVVKALARRSPRSLDLTLRQCAVALGINDSAMSALFALGHLETVYVRNDAIRKQRALITKVSFDAFREEHISSRNLAVDLNVSPQRLSNILNDAYFSF